MALTVEHQRSHVRTAIDLYPFIDNDNSYTSLERNIIVDNPIYSLEPPLLFWSKYQSRYTRRLQDQHFGSSLFQRDIQMVNCSPLQKE